MRGALAMLAVLVVSSPARRTAAQVSEGGLPRAGESSWLDYAAPQRRIARQLVRDGLVWLLEALGPVNRASATPETDFEHALLRFERARRSLPRDPDLLYFRAVALAEWSADIDADGVEERRTDEAIEAYHDLRRVAPDYHADRVAFALGILHARRREHHRAIAEYERAIAGSLPHPVPLHYIVGDRELALVRLFEPIQPSSALLNLAEALMLLGDEASLARAIASYRRALALASDEPADRVLALWGLAIALDRAGDHREAITTAQRAIQGDPVPDDNPSLGIDHRTHGPMAILHSILVFFEPAAEVHAYDALGWEALARRASGQEDRRELLERALRSWRQFLHDRGGASPYSQHAQQAIARLESEIRSVLSDRVPARSPRPQLMP